MATPESEVVGVPAAARLLGVSPQAVRTHLRAGSLKASKRQGTFGETWYFRPAVLRAFAVEHYGRETPEEGLAPSTPAPTPQPLQGEDVRELYERIVALTEEATRYKTIAETSESTKAAAERDYQAMLAELAQERDAAQVKADEAQTKAEEAAAELARLRARGFWGRLFGGKA